MVELSPKKLWKHFVSNDQGNNAQGDDLLSGLHFDLDDAGQISSITYRDFASSTKVKNPKITTTISPDTTKYEQIVWTQFFHLLFNSLKECGYFGEAKKPYPYFLPSLVLEGFVIRSEQQQGYNEVLKKYLDDKYSVSKPEKPEKSNNLNNREIEYALFETNNFFGLKGKIGKLASSDPRYFDSAYVLHYLSTKGMTPKSYISGNFETIDKKSANFANCVETGMCNFYGLFLPFDQITGGINLAAVKNIKMLEYLEANNNVDLRDFTGKFLVDQPWMPYKHLKVENKGIDLGDVLYIKLPAQHYEYVKTQLQHKITEKEPIQGCESFQIKDDKDIGHNLVFVKDNQNVTLYEVKSGLMGFYLFEQMIYSQVDPYQSSFDQFLDIITDKNKTKTLPVKFTETVKDNYKIELKINTDFDNARLVWRGACNANALKFSPNEPLRVKFHITDGHTHVNFDVGGSSLPMSKESSSLPGFLQVAMWSSSQPPLYDNFDCQPWLWLVRNVYKKETIIKKEWDQAQKKYVTTTFKDLIDKYPQLKCNIYNQHLLLDPSWEMPDDILSSKSLELAAKPCFETLLKKIISSVTPPRLSELLSNPDEYDRPSIINIARSNRDSLKPIFDVFKGEPKILEQLMKVKDQYNKTLMHEIASNYEFLKFIFDVFKGEPKILEQLLEVKDQYNKIPVHTIASEPECLKLIFDVFKGKPELLKEMLCMLDNFNRSPMHFVAMKTHSLNLLFDVFKDNPELLKELLGMQDNFYRIN